MLRLMAGNGDFLCRAFMVLVVNAAYGVTGNADTAAGSSRMVRCTAAAAFFKAGAAGIATVAGVGTIHLDISLTAVSV